MLLVADQSRSAEIETLVYLSAGLIVKVLRIIVANVSTLTWDIRPYFKLKQHI